MHFFTNHYSAETRYRWLVCIKGREIEITYILKLGGTLDENIVENWDKEGCSFAGSCLRTRHQVAVAEHSWDRVLLHRSGLVVPRKLNVVANYWTKLHLRELEKSVKKSFQFQSFLLRIIMTNLLTKTNGGFFNRQATFIDNQTIANHFPNHRQQQGFVSELSDIKLYHFI